MAEAEPQFQFLTFDLIGSHDTPEQGASVVDESTGSVPGVTPYTYYLTGSICGVFALAALAWGICKIRGMVSNGDNSKKDK